jgi:hypothetical protein
MPMFSGYKTILLAPVLSEIALKSFPSPDSDVKVLHIYPLTDLETHMVADHGREEFVEFIEERRIDLFSDRTDYNGEACNRSLCSRVFVNDIHIFPCQSMGNARFEE